LRRGEKVAFVGKNGEGKSTLVKCIMDEIDYTGSLKLGAGVQIGYYAQNQAQLLDGELTVFDTIDRVARGDIRLKIRDILGAFMFGGEASDKKVKVLSGGERSRLAMIKLLLEPVNFLILDEPTNHLDMRTKDVLKEAIAAFDGTAIIVSHDRYFLDGLVDRVYAFGGGQVREHLGGIADYLTLLNNGEGTVSATTAAATTSSSATTATTATAPKVSAGRQNYEERKELARQRRKIEKEVEACEEKVTALEQQKADIEAQLSTPEGAADASLFTRHAETVEAIRQAEEAWEQALEALEALNA
ncbi:MAG: ATP-binding cassette domain-containing protein, partial [Alloprevotella sp.]|nr:ATP-binding cassette domain-containing protein [Alloprevotella sp.]